MPTSSDAAAASMRTRRGAHLLATLRDTGRRNIYLSAAAIPLHLVTAGWKGALLLLTPSLFMLANVIFTLGMVVLKTLVVSADRRCRAGDDHAALRAYRRSGIVLLILAGLYGTLCLPLVLGLAVTPRYGYEVSIAIAAVTFAELGLSVHGLVSSRRRRDTLMEAVKLGNIAASLVLLVLTQTALLSMATDGEHSLWNGVCALVMATAVAGIGAGMLVRAARSTPRRARRRGRRDLRKDIGTGLLVVTIALVPSAIGAGAISLAAQF